MVFEKEKLRSSLWLRKNLKVKILGKANEVIFVGDNGFYAILHAFTIVKLGEDYISCT